MKTLKFFLIIMLTLFLLACSQNTKETEAVEGEVATEEIAKGIGAVENMDLKEELVDDLIAVGMNSYEGKCSGCHLLTEERKVGPGWSGITNRRSPEWIMNMITNVNTMLEEDPDAQKLLDECMTHMPDQSISIEDARGILEFMRSNDVKTVGSKDQAGK